MAFNDAGVRDTARMLKTGGTLAYTFGPGTDETCRELLARKTTCFSRSIEVHEKLIGSFIEKYMFY